MSLARGHARPRTLLVATHSDHKLRELRELLHLPNSTLVSLDDVGIADDAVEDSETFDANAIAKARFYAARSGLPTLADDSGIEVDALGGRPGVRSHRYAHEDASDEENNQALLAELSGVAPELRTARYRCSLVLAELAMSGTEGGRPAVGGGHPASRSAHAGEAATSAARITIRRGTFEGRIAAAPRGTGGFGYDPLFEPATEPPGGRTVGLYSAAEKHRVSHRARAARAMRRVLVGRGY